MVRPQIQIHRSFVPFIKNIYNIQWFFYFYLKIFFVITISCVSRLSIIMSWLHFENLRCFVFSFSVLFEVFYFSRSFFNKIIYNKSSINHVLKKMPILYVSQTFRALISSSLISRYSEYTTIMRYAVTAKKKKMFLICFHQ